MATEKVAPINMAEVVEDVEEIGPMTGSASLGRALQGIRPEDVAGLYEQRGTNPADRMGAAIKLQQIVNEINGLVGSHGLSKDQHFNLLRGLGSESPLGEVAAEVEERMPELPEETRVAAAENLQERQVT